MQIKCILSKDMPTNEKYDPNIFVCNIDVLGSNTPSLNYRIKQKQKTKKHLKPFYFKLDYPSFVSNILFPFPFTFYLT